MKHIPIACILAEVPRKDEGQSALAAALAGFPRVGGVRRTEGSASPDPVALAREEGRAEARAEYEALRKEDAERFAAELAAARKEWSETEAVKLGTQIEEGLQHVEQAIADVTARLLKPLLVERAVRAALDDLAAVLRQIMTDRPGVSLKISGPGDLLERLQARFADLANATFTASESPDIRIETDQTVIESCLAPWAARLADGGA